MSDEFKRKLTAILSADVVGYSRLMSDNEEETVRTLKSYRKVVESLIAKFSGRLVDNPGDNMLAEFSSVVDALRCAWDIQQEIKSRNLDLPGDRKMMFRIGVNLGDVIEEEGRIYGDGVNTAARLESLADAGGICISGNVYNYVKNKVSFRFENQGEQSVKNIDDPIQVYRVLMEGETTKKEKIKTETEEEEFKLPEGPSIAVLPFVNMSGDASQEYICDGITENIITSLSYNPKLFVIARNSTFYFKGKSVPVQEVAEKLNVRYVLEGSFQKVANRVRITAQLIDAKTGHHLCAEKYDRDFKDFFDLQDEIAEKIFTVLAVRLTDGEWAKIFSSYSISLEARFKIMKAASYMNRGNIEDNILARKEAEEALSLSPESPLPKIILAYTYIGEYWLDPAKSHVDSLIKVTQLAKSALKLDEKNPDAYLILGNLSFISGNHEQAITYAKKAIELNPNYNEAYHQVGVLYIYFDKPEKGLELIKKAVRLNPIPPAYYYVQLGNAYGIMGKYKEAISALKKAIDIEPDSIIAHIILATNYSLSGQHEKANKEVSEVLRIDSNFTLETTAERWPYKNPDVKDRIVDALRKAGLK